MQGSPPPPSACGRLPTRRLPPGLLSRRLLLAALGLAVPDAARAQPSGLLRTIRDRRQIRIGILVDLPPWDSYGEFGAPDGSEVALARLLAVDLDVAVRLVPLRAQDRIPALLEERVDVLSATLPITPATLQHVAFAASHGAMAAVIATRANQNIRAFGDLAGKRIAVSAGSSTTEAALERLHGAAEIVVMPDSAAGLQALFAGSVDAAVTYDWELRDVVMHQPGGTVVHALDLMSWRHAMAVRQGEHDLLRFINTFLFLRSTDGTLADIHWRYFRAPPPSPVLFR